MIWVLAAVALAGVNFWDFRATEKLSSLLLTGAWLLLAFSWYAKPFQINFRERLCRAFVTRPLRTWLTQSAWNFATIGAFVLLTVGLALKFANAA